MAPYKSLELRREDVPHGGHGGCGLQDEQYFVSGGAGFDAAKNSTEDFLIVGNAWLRLAPMANRLNEMIQDRNASIHDRLYKRYFLWSFPWMFDDYLWMKPVSYLFVFLAPPKHPGF